MKKVITIIIVILIVLGVGKYALIDYSYIPENSNFTISLEKVRALANSKSILPLHINYLNTAKGELIRWTIMAGDRSVSNQYIQTSFQIVYHNKFVILDTPMNRAQCSEFYYCHKFYNKNYEILQKAIEKADLIFFTHEHWDHTGGVAKSSHLNKKIANIILTSEQLNSSLLKEAGFPAGILERIQPLNYKDYYLIAPGIVLIKAPGHTNGHQMVFVKLMNGNEYLFSGDSVWRFANIKKERARPFLVYLIGGENPGQVGDEIRQLSKIYHNTQNNISIVPNHDIDILNEYLKKGLLGNNYKL